MSIETNLFQIQTSQVRLIRKEKVRVIRMVRALVPFAEVKEIGSTAVAGVIGKQDLDVLVRVENKNFGLAKRKLDECFSRNEAQLSNEDIQGYRIDSKADIALQLVVKDGPYDCFDEFLTALLQDASLRAAYNCLKMQWDGKSMQEYRTAKGHFIEDVLAKMRQKK